MARKMNLLPLPKKLEIIYSNIKTLEPNRREWEGNNVEEKNENFCSNFPCKLRIGNNTILCDQKGTRGHLAANKDFKSPSRPTSKLAGLGTKGNKHSIFQLKLTFSLNGVQMPLALNKMKNTPSKNKIKFIKSPTYSTTQLQGSGFFA